MDPTTDMITRLVGQLGFPIVVAGWLLYQLPRLGSKVEEATAQLKLLVEAVKAEAEAESLLLTEIHRDLERRS